MSTYKEMGGGEGSKYVKLSYPEAFLNVLFREWACFFSKRLHPESGKKYIDFAQSSNAGGDIRSYLISSKCMQEVAKMNEALKDAEQAYAQNPFQTMLCLQLADTIYDKNRFEETLISLSDDSRKFHVNKARILLEERDIVLENFKDNLGDNLLPFYIKYSTLLRKLAADRLAKENFIPQPKWKLRMEANECDVQSVTNEPIELLHPRIVEKRKLNKRIFRQVYLPRSWKDLQFLLELTNDKTLFLPQTSRSTEKIKNILENDLHSANEYLRMLHARSPFYSERGDNLFDKKNYRQIFKENYLYGKQNSIRREIYYILNDLKELRKNGKIKELESYIYDKMSNYTILKTKRLLPWKFQFINEVYNILGLTYFDQLIVPNNIAKYDVTKHLSILLKIQKRNDRNVKFVFGDKSTYTEPDAIDYDYINYRKYIVKLENWLKFVVYPIEKCFIYHEIARKHIEQGKLKDCALGAKKVQEEAEACKNKVWQILARFMYIRVRTYQKIWKDVDASLVQLEHLTKSLKDPQFKYFLTICHESVKKLNTDVKNVKKESKKGDKKGVKGKK